MNELGFRDFMNEIDAEVLRIAGVSVYDLPDCIFGDWYELGASAEEAARMALEEADWVAAQAVCSKRS